MWVHHALSDKVIRTVSAPAQRHQPGDVDRLVGTPREAVCPGQSRVSGLRAAAGGYEVSVANCSDAVDDILTAGIKVLLG